MISTRFIKRQITDPNPRNARLAQRELARVIEILKDLDRRNAYERQRRAGLSRRVVK